MDNKSKIKQFDRNLRSNNNESIIKQFNHNSNTGSRLIAKNNKEE